MESIRNVFISHTPTISFGLSFEPEDSQYGKSRETHIEIHQALNGKQGGMN